MVSENKHTNGERNVNLYNSMEYKSGKIYKNEEKGNSILGAHPTYLFTCAAGFGELSHLRFAISHIGNLCGPLFAVK